MKQHPYMDTALRGICDVCDKAPHPLHGPEQRHPFTCAYCTGGPSGNRPAWAERSGFELHMEQVHYGLPREVDR